jgi:hypothetical protein
MTSSRREISLHSTKGTIMPLSKTAVEQFERELKGDLKASRSARSFASPRPRGKPIAVKRKAGRTASRPWSKTSRRA